MSSSINVLNKLSLKSRRLIGSGVGTCIFTLLVLFYCFSQSLAADPDLFARVAIGRWIEKFRHVPIVDPFAFTPRKPIFIDHEWLSGLVFYQISQLGGDHALYLFKLFIVTLSLVLLFFAKNKWRPHQSQDFLWFLICITNCLYLWSSTIRSQIFTFLLIPFLLFSILSFEKNRRILPLICVVILMPFWAGFHGGFVVGIGLLSIYLVSLILRKQLKSAIVIFCFLVFAVAGTGLNPYGVSTYWVFIFEAITMERPTITEWAPISLTAHINIVTFSILAILMVGFLKHKKTSQDILPFLMLLVPLFFGLRSQRLIGIFCFNASVFGTDYYRSFLQYLHERFPISILKLTRAGGISFAILFIFFGFHQLLFFTRFYRFSLDYSEYPVAATTWLKNSGLKGNILVDFNNGSYVLWRLHPDFLVSLDGRYEEVYPESTVSLVSSALNPQDPNFHDSLRALNPDFILFPTTGNNRNHLKRFGDLWRIIFDDGGPFLVLSVKEKVSSRVYPTTNHWKPAF